MRKLADLLTRKNSSNKAILDDKTIYYFFNKVIEREYGNKGLAKLKPDFLKNGKLFVRAESSVWSGELWTNREDIVKKINAEIGSKEVREIKLKN